MNILLSEDNPVNQKLAIRLLEKAGHRVTLAGTGREALTAWERATPPGFDLVLMDIQMPLLDGVQATKRIRTLPPPKNAVPIIALTAHAMTGAKEEYLAAEMDDYLSKPFHLQELLLRKAGEISAEGHRAAMTAPEPAHEYEIQAVVEYTFARLGGERPAYGSIVGSGANGTQLSFHELGSHLKAQRVFGQEAGFAVETDVVAIILHLQARDIRGLREAAGGVTKFGLKIDVLSVITRRVGVGDIRSNEFLPGTEKIHVSF